MVEGRGVPPDLRQIMDQYGVNVPDTYEAIWNPLYDYQATVAAAQASQKFFLTPVGQSNKTLEDTNMVLAGQIQSGNRFLITSIEIDFTPDLDIGATAADDQFLEDVYDFGKRGNIVMTIGDKPYLKAAPIRRFPPTSRLGGFSSVATTASTVTYSYNYAQWCGKEFAIRGLVLMAGQSFDFDIQNRPALSTTGRVGVTLNGWLFRNAQ